MACQPIFAKAWRIALARVALLVLMVAAVPQVCAAANAIDYVVTPAASADVIIDSRPGAKCETASLPGARCLPAGDFLGPHKRLANVSGLLWLLGTVGLTGAEHVLVIGDQSRAKEFMAGLLYIAGQQKITVLRVPITKPAKGKLVPGISRSKTREQIYRAAMRSDSVVLRSDLAVLLRSKGAPVILDGRSETEYWGRERRAMRGGHVPGAQHLAMTSLRPGNNAPPPIHLENGNAAIAYAHGSYDGLVYLARLTASGINAKIYLEGWSGWASDGALPADSVTYVDAGRRRVNGAAGAGARNEITSLMGWPMLAVMVISGIGLFAAGYVASRAIAKQSG